MSTLLKNLKSEFQGHLKSAQDIAKLVVERGDDYTVEEKTSMEQHLTAANDLKGRIAAAKADEDALSGLAAFGAGLGLGSEADTVTDIGLVVPGAKAQSLGSAFVKSEAFTGAMGRHATSAGIPQKTQFQTDAVRFKSLFTGSGTGQGGAFIVADRTDILERAGRRSGDLRPLINVRRTTSDVVEFRRELAHTNNARITPEATSDAPIGTGTGQVTATAGGLKAPTSDWTFEIVREPVKTITATATTTTRAIADVAALEDLINDELLLDLVEVEQQQILNGNGSGENFTGILQTSGIQARAFTNDIVETIRWAINDVEVVGKVGATAVVMHPNDITRMELLRDKDGRFLGQGPYGGSEPNVWRKSVVSSEYIAEGNALVGGFGKAVLWDREDASVAATNTHADYFFRNLIAILAEQRLAFGVTRPKAFCVADLTA